VPVRENPILGRTPFWAAMREGLDFVRGHRLLVHHGDVRRGVAAVQSSGDGGANFVCHAAARPVGAGRGLSYVTLGVGTVLASANGHRVVRRFGPGPTLVLGLPSRVTGWLLLSLAPLNAFGVVAYALMLMMFGVGAVFIFINFLSLRQSVTPGPMLGRMTSTMRWLILIPAGPGARCSAAGWASTWVCELRWALQGTTALILALVAWRRPVIRSVTTLPTLKAEAITPYSSD